MFQPSDNNYSLMPLLCNLILMLQLRLMQSELSVEEVIQQRTFKVRLLNVLISLLLKVCKLNNIKYYIISDIVCVQLWIYCAFYSMIWTSTQRITTMANLALSQLGLSC